MSGNEDFHCGDCTEKFHTKLAAKGHAGAQGHEVENIRSGLVIRHE